MKTFLPNTTYVTYTYCPNEYVTSGWAKNITNLVPGFFVLALFIAAAFIIFYILRNEGVSIDN